MLKSLLAATVIAVLLGLTSASAQPVITMGRVTLAMGGRVTTAMGAAIIPMAAAMATAMAMDIRSWCRE
jgi:hypothetical protein